MKYEFQNFDPSIAFQSLYHMIRRERKVFFIQQKFLNGKYERKSLVLGFKDIESKIVNEYSEEMPVFLNTIDPKLYINGIFAQTISWITILVNINGLNKYCLTKYDDTTRVSHIFIESFFSIIKYFLNSVQIRKSFQTIPGL